MSLPDLVLESIFLYVPATSLVKSHLLVCKKWYTLIESQVFWMKKCSRDGKLTASLKEFLDKNVSNWNAKELYFSKLYVTDNLLKNPTGKELFKDWWINKTFPNNSQFNSSHYYFPKNIIYGFSFNIKELINNYEKYKQSSLDLNNAKWSVYYNKEEFSFVTTYSLGEKIQIIDLNEMNLLSELKRFKLEISESYSARNTFKYIYFLRVYVVNRDYKIVDQFKHEHLCREDEYPLKLKNVRHCFKCDDSIRFIIYYHSGQVNYRLKF